MACPSVFQLPQVWVAFRGACGGALVEGSCGAAAKGFPGMRWQKLLRILGGWLDLAPRWLEKRWWSRSKALCSTPGSPMQ